jgi:hypothetical protein
MSALAFTDQRERLRRIVESALTGATYESSREEEGGRMLVIEAKRADGRHIGLRFRGVRDSEATEAPAPGASLRLKTVGSAEKFSLLRLFFPLARTPGSGAARVRIEAGSARLDIVCEDAEWWEADEPPR